MALKIPSARAIEKLPWVARTLLGALIAAIAVGLAYLITPLRAYPLLLSFPAVVLSGWFLGMAGAFGCAVVDVVLIDLFLTQSRFRFATGFVDQEIRFSIFFILSTLLGVLLRRWA